MASISNVIFVADAHIHIEIRDPNETNTEICFQNIVLPVGTSFHHKESVQVSNVSKSDAQQVCDTFGIFQAEETILPVEGQGRR